MHNCLPVVVDIMPAASAAGADAAVGVLVCMMYALHHSCLADGTSCYYRTFLQAGTEMK
jgi:hypothetical protein